MWFECKLCHLRQESLRFSVDSLHLAPVPVLLGQGERLFEGLDLRALGYSVTDRKASEYATHLTLERV